MTDDIRDLFSYQLALLARANDRIAQTQLISEWGLTLGEWRVLAIIRVLSPCTSRRLATEEFLDEGQVSRTVKILAERGWVERQPSDQDKRAVLLSLTSAGEALYQSIFGHVIAANEDTLSDLPPKDRRLLVKLMKRMLGGFRAAAG